MARFIGRPRVRVADSDRASMDRVLFALFDHENQNQGVSTALLMT
jgi:hypothetical protein